MKFAHFADIHLGYEQYHQSWRAEDFARVFREAVEKAVAEKVDFAIIAGDLFHRSVPNPKAIKDSIESLSILKENNIPVFAIEGNHDKTVREVSIYDLLESLGLLNLLGLRKKRVDGEYVRCERIGNVYLVKGVFDGVEIIGDTYRTSWQLSKVLPYLKAESDESILALHQSIKEVVDVDVEESHELTLNELPEASYYAMGHIHAARVYEYNGKYIVYPGCLERYDAKEASLAITYKEVLNKGEGPKKGFYIVEDFVPRFVEVNARNLVTAYIQASNAEEAEKRLIEVLDFVGPEDLLLAKVVSEASVDVANLIKMASKKALFTKVDYKPLRKTFEAVKVAGESEFFTDLELRLLEHLRSNLDDVELQAAVDIVREHFGLTEENTEEKKEDKIGETGERSLFD